MYFFLFISGQVNRFLENKSVGSIYLGVIHKWRHGLRGWGGGGGLRFCDDITKAFVIKKCADEGGGPGVVKNCPKYCVTSFMDDPFSVIILYIQNKPGCESVDAFEADSGIPSFHLICFVDKFHHLLDIRFLTFSKSYYTYNIRRYFLIKVT